MTDLQISTNRSRGHCGNKYRTNKTNTKRIHVPFQYTTFDTKQDSGEEIFFQFRFALLHHLISISKSQLGSDFVIRNSNLKRHHLDHHLTKVLAYFLKNVQDFFLSVGFGTPRAASSIRRGAAASFVGSGDGVGYILRNGTQRFIDSQYHDDDYCGKY